MESNNEFDQVLSEHDENSVKMQASLSALGADEAVPLTRNIETTAPLIGGGTLENDLNLGLNASSTAIANYVILRDANGRARVAAPSSSSDIARRAEVDAVEEKLDTVESKIPTLSDAVNSTSSTVAASSKAVKAAYDKAASIGTGFVPSTRNITTTAPLSGGGGMDTDLILGINASSTATANSVIMRDAGGRARVAAPVAASDIARKEDVDTVGERLDTVESKIPVLSDAVNSTSSTVAASSKAVKAAYDKAASIGTGFVPSTRSITTTAPLSGGGAMSTDLVLGINASSTATADSVILRDAEGRAKVAAPSASSDIARKEDVDAVEAKIPALSDAVNSSSGTIAASSKAVKIAYDQAVAAQTASVPATRSTVTTSPLNGGGALNANLTLSINASSLATANYVIQRDACSRAQIAAPSAPADIANKEYVDAVVEDSSNNCREAFDAQIEAIIARLTALENKKCDCDCNGGGTDPDDGGDPDTGPGMADIVLLNSSGNCGYSDVAFNDNSYYVSGYANGSGNLSGAGGLVAKFDKNLGYLGAVTIKAGTSSYVQGMVASRDGGCVAVGNAINPGQTGPNLYQGFIVSLDKDMKVIEKKLFSNSSKSVFFKVAATPTDFVGSARYVAIGQQEEPTRENLICLFDKDLNLLKQAVFKQMYCSPTTYQVLTTKEGLTTLTGSAGKSILITTFDRNLSILKTLLLRTSVNITHGSRAKTAGGYVVSCIQDLSYDNKVPFIILLDENLNPVKEVRLQSNLVEKGTYLTVTPGGNIVFKGLRGSDTSLIVLNKDLEIIKQLTTGTGSVNDVYNSVLVTQSGEYAMIGGVTGVGKGNNAASLSVIKGDFATLPTHFSKYPTVVIDNDPGYSVQQTITAFTVERPTLTMDNPNLVLRSNSITTTTNPADIAIDYGAITA